MFEVIEEKMSEAIRYNSVAVIINVDSFIVLNQSESDSSMGRSKSYSISDHNMYRMLLHYMKEFAKIQEGKDKWMTMIVQNNELLKMLQRDLKWPLSPEERKQQQEQEQLNKERECKRCGAFYKEVENREERKCMQHPGFLIDLQRKNLETVLSVQDAKL